MVNFCYKQWLRAMITLLIYIENVQIIRLNCYLASLSLILRFLLTEVSVVVTRSSFIHSCGHFVVIFVSQFFRLWHMKVGHFLKM